MAQLGGFPVGKAFENGHPGLTQKTESGGRGPGIQLAVGGHDRHAGDERHERIHARKRNKSVGRSLPKPHYAAYRSGRALPAGCFAAPGSAAHKERA